MREGATQLYPFTQWSPMPLLDFEKELHDVDYPSPMTSTEELESGF